MEGDEPSQAGKHHDDRRPAFRWVFWIPLAMMSAMPAKSMAQGQRLPWFVLPSYSERAAPASRPPLSTVPS